jgi:hypothetical protein
MYVSRQELGDAYDENAMKRQLAIIAPVLIAVSLVTAGSAKAGTHRPTSLCSQEF